jgi:hypothetical protein
MTTDLAAILYECHQATQENITTALHWLIDLFIMSMRWVVSEPRPSMGLFISRWYLSVESHGDDDVGWGKLLIRLPELSGNPYSRVIWEQVRGMDERARILPIQYLRYLNGSLTCRKILQGTSGFTSHQKEVALKSLSPRPSLKPRTVGPEASTRTSTSPRRLSALHSTADKVQRTWKKYPNNRPYYGSTFL